MQAVSGAPNSKLQGWMLSLLRVKQRDLYTSLLTNDKVTIKDARFLWGMDAYETEEAIKKELKDANIRVACIGPAGEKRSRISCYY